MATHCGCPSTQELSAPATNTHGTETHCGCPPTLQLAPLPPTVAQETHHNDLLNVALFHTDSLVLTRTKCAHRVELTVGGEDDQHVQVL